MTCQLFNLAGGDTFQFTTILAVPDGAEGTLTDHAYVSFDTGVSDGGGTGREVIVCANTSGETLPCGTPEGTSVIADFEADDKAGGLVTRDGAADVLATTGSLSQAGDVLTQLQIPFRAAFPNGFGATIVEAEDPAEDACPASVSCFGQTVVEDLAGHFDTADPVVGDLPADRSEGQERKEHRRLPRRRRRRLVRRDAAVGDRRHLRPESVAESEDEGRHDRRPLDRQRRLGLRLGS